MMLQRAASNAYSWWWASHIRTKQSKWLEQNLQDIEEKVQYVLKLLQEDGDSFAKRAEMYYKKRPELISFVEESYRAYRALAERYDHISTELQNANTTIASVFPDQVPEFAMDDDYEEDESMSRLGKKPPPNTSKSHAPNAPKLPAKDLKGMITSASKNLQPRKSMKIIGSAAKVAKSSGLSKDEATVEIDKRQKEILALQTEKEFVKSSYESGLAKYWEIEKHIKENHERICDLQDEFGESIVIEDDEARRVMAETAIKACQEKLTQLQEKQERSLEEAKQEHERIRESRQKLNSLAGKFLGNENPFMKDESGNSEREFEQNLNDITQKQKELESLRKEIKEQFEVGLASLTVTEMAEKIDELVNKVISLETAVSSQTSLIQRLRTETNNLQAQMHNLEDDKVTLADDKNELKNKLKEMEKKLKNLQDLDEIVAGQNNKLQTHFTEACCDLDRISVKLSSVKPDGETAESAEKLNSGKEEGKVAEIVDESDKQKGEMAEVEEHGTRSAEKQNHVALDGIDVQEKNLDRNCGSELAQGAGKGTEEAVAAEKKQEDTYGQFKSDGGLDSLSRNQTSEKSDRNPTIVPAKQLTSVNEYLVKDGVLEKQLESVLSSDAQQEKMEKEVEPDWKQMFLNGMEDKEKLLLSEYTTVLRNFKDVNKKLSDTETQLMNSNATKDDEIRSLREKLILLQKSLGDANHLIDSRAMDSKEDGKNAIGMMVLDRTESMSPTEEKFRMSIDELLEENLDFWLRFSSSFGQIQKFDTSIEDLQAEISKLEDKRKQDGSSTAKNAVRSDVRPIYRHLREIQTDLSVWLEKGAALKDELKSRFESLCNIQEEITIALRTSAEDDDFKFTSYQAAKFQGEVLNMKQENNKVADELQAGLDHITMLQVEVEKTLVKLSDEYGLSGSRNSMSNRLQHSESRIRVPLRSFIFGSKPKKQKASIFSCMHPSLYRYKKTRSTSS